jgi:N-methylhydantoinase A/oxoprolinase/acetone carboxylase beta subunit
VRYRGQSFELTVPLGPGLEERFHAAHEERYGYADRERELELVAVRTAEVRPGPEIDLPAARQAAAPTARIEGPARVELEGATAWIPLGWVGDWDGPTLRVTRL